MTMDQLDVNQKARIIHITGNDFLKKRLLEMGLTTHTVIKIHKKAPLHGPIEIGVRGYALSLRYKVAQRIQVVLL